MAAIPHSADAPREPLELSAPLAWREAPRSCWVDASGTRCDWFHRIWQVLRLLGVNTTPEHHAAFFREGMRKLDGARRVLISGTADYSLLAQLLPALRASRPDIVVVDRCETALMLNRWYAARHETAIATERCDILEHAGGDYDLVCTHSFIGQFDPVRRAQLFRKWHGMLRPGGMLLSVNRLRPAAADGWLGYTSEQAVALADDVRRRVVEVGAIVGASAPELAEAALQYARRMGAWPVRSMAEIQALCEGAGFSAEHLSAEPVVLHRGAKLSGPSVPAGADYARVVAIRR